MHRSSTIMSELPTLRRYARAVTGNQEVGDQYVAKVLENIVAKPGLISSETPVKIGLYQEFSRCLNKDLTENRNGAIPVTSNNIADERLSRLSPRPRQAYLLLALENFTEEEAAQVLGTDASELRKLANHANREMIDQVAADVLIIEDEPMIALDLKEIMTNLGHRVTAVARTHKEAVAALEAQTIGLVLADIQLADGSSGIEAVNEILGTVGGVPVVFITAYPERLLTGDKPEPTFLITKPFQPDTVKAITSQALFFNLRAKPNDIADLRSAVSLPQV